MDKLYNREESTIEERPSPDDFDLYLPWACKQLQLRSFVQVVKVYQNEYVSVVTTERSKKGKSRCKLTPTEMTTDHVNESASAVIQVFDVDTAKVIKVLAIYDMVENLVHIKFEKNTELPRVLVKIIGLIIRFQNHLNTITIHCPIDQSIVYEISRILPRSCITDLCFDDSCLKGPNYHILLENTNSLKHLSLCRCNIDDVTIERICSCLMYPLPASKTLSILNLSSNRITDEGALSLANVLRSNRQLSYINLAGNIITDKGAAAILNTLKEFPLGTEEILAAKTRQMTFLRNRNDMIALTIADLRLNDADKKFLGKRKSIRPVTTNPKKPKADTSQKSLIEATDGSLLEKAMNIVQNAVGNFVDPFSNTNTVVRNNVTYCRGNNAVCCLNLSFNYVSYITLKNLQSVLLYQRIADRKPRGLMSVSVEGNCMPIACKELTQIDNILEINLSAETRAAASKKRQQTKNPSRHYDV